MELRQPCEKCGARNRENITAKREDTIKPNGTGEMTFIAQGQKDLAKLEALFPKEDADAHELSFRWENEYEVTLIRRRVPAAAPSSPAPTATVTQASLEKLSKEDLETKAAELGVTLPANGSKAAWAKLIVDAIQKKNLAAV